MQEAFQELIAMVKRMSISLWYICSGLRAQMLCPASMLGLWCWSSRLWGPWFSPQWTSGGSAKFAGEGREHLHKWCTWSHLNGTPTGPESWRLWGPSTTNAWPTRPTNRRNHLSSLTQHESRCGRWSYQGAECHSERSSASDPTCFTRKAQEVQKIREKCSSFVPFICMNHFIFPHFGDDVPLFPVIYLCSPEPGGFGHQKFSGQSLPMSGQHSCMQRCFLFFSEGEMSHRTIRNMPRKVESKARVRPAISDIQWWSMMVDGKMGWHLFWGHWNLLIPFVYICEVFLLKEINENHTDCVVAGR